MRRPSVRPFVRLLVGPVVGVVVLAGCSDEATHLAEVEASASAAAAESGPAEVAMPATLTAYVDQGRIDRVGRSVYVRLVNDAETPVTVSRAVVDSDRYDEVVWTGDKEVINEGDLDFELPVSRCGTGSDARVTLTYRVGDGPEVVSVTEATDRYGAIGLFLDRDCAQETMGEAADVVVGRPEVVGVGLDSRFRLPVRVTATGARDDVAFAGFEGTVLFRPTEPTPVFGETGAVPLAAGTENEVVLNLVPTRCDPHALAEDKVGTLIGVHVVAPGLPANASYYLPISDQTRADLRGFFSTHCGL